ncbi:hypothetical protein G210_5553 [Candida maltosa Xu316]|uniref:Golgi apparatus membrane protein TVP23 n=1 Tax=Candida maltosa (strain Xu316) TaxID=1245528 RepID=M3K4H3_CANMX|nr:hypothetical protein G210_5553 [Candida maltosa Xu316]
MSSGYTAIEPDEPIDTPPSYSTTDNSTKNVPSSTTTAPPPPPPQSYTQGPTQPQVQEPTQQPETLIDRLKQSSHPVALLFYMFFRISPIFVYIFGTIVIKQVTSENTFILHFITLILLIAADFWNLKNIAGRLLVGLRWWNETNLVESEGADKNFENVWVFESADPNRYINPIDSKVFWILLYGQPAAWIVLGFLALLRFQFLYMLLIAIAVSLSMTNAMAFTKCDKFGKANNIANDIFSRATGSMFSRFNPFAR